MTRLEDKRHKELNSPSTSGGFSVVGKTETRVCTGCSVVGETETRACTYLGDGGEIEGPKNAILTSRVSKIEIGFDTIEIIYLNILYYTILYYTILYYTIL